jgi:hypothetical protein
MSHLDGKGLRTARRRRVVRPKSPAFYIVCNEGLLPLCALCPGLHELIHRAHVCARALHHFEATAEHSGLWDAVHTRPPSADAFDVKRGLVLHHSASARLIARRRATGIGLVSACHDEGDESLAFLFRRQQRRRPHAQLELLVTRSVAQDLEVMRAAFEGSFDRRLPRRVRAAVLQNFESRALEVFGAEASELRESRIAREALVRVDRLGHKARLAKLHDPAPGYGPQSTTCRRLARFTAALVLMVHGFRLGERRLWHAVAHSARGHTVLLPAQTVPRSAPALVLPPVRLPPLPPRPLAYVQGGSATCKFFEIFQRTKNLQTISQ